MLITYFTENIKMFCMLKEIQDAKVEGNFDNG